MPAITVENAYVHSIDFKSIPRENTEHPVDLATLRVRIDRSYRSGRDESGSPIWNRDKDFWTDVQVWGARAKALQDVISKGASVLLTGRYDIGEWEDDSGNKHRSVVFRAFHVAILPWCIESVTYRSKDSGGPARTDQSAWSDGFDEDIPF